MNLLIGLIMDIVIVGVIKAAARRRRPTINDDIFSLGPDKFRQISNYYHFFQRNIFYTFVSYLYINSFPSGHATRAFLVLIFFTVLDPMPMLLWPPIFAWAVSVSFSRLLMYRHHILDMIAGILIGCLEAALLSIIWLDHNSAAWLMSFISDERLPGTQTQEEAF